MLIAPALLALLIPFQAEQPQGGAIVVEGKTIPLRFVPNAMPVPPEGFLQWQGFEYLKGAEAKLFEPYSVTTDWAPVASAYDAVKDQPGTPWRTKIVVFARTALLAKNAQGVVPLHREILNQTQINAVLEAIARAKAYLKAETKGALDLVPDVQIENTLMFGKATDVPFGHEFISEYLTPRINGGGYEPEDGVFRGPYHSAIYILPDSNHLAPMGTIINGTPVAQIAMASTVADMDEQANIGRIERAIVDAVVRQAAMRVTEAGFAGYPETIAETQDGWKLAADLSPLSTDQLLDRLRGTAPRPVFDRADLSVMVKSWISGGATATFTDDPTRGQVLRFTEQALSRYGGVGLPMRADGLALTTISETPTLNFFARTTHKDPISIRVQDKEGKVFWISLGRTPLPAIPSGRAVSYYPFETNGEWQQVKIDLRPLAAQVNMSEIAALAIEPSPDSFLSEQEDYGTGEFFFDDFSFGTEPGATPLPPVSGSAKSPDAMARALAAATATAASPDLLDLLKDRNPTVRLNAAMAYQRIKDPAAEAQLTLVTGDSHEEVQLAALDALAYQDTETALESVRNVLRRSLSHHARGRAAELLARKNEQKYVGDILLLFTSPSWQARISGVKAMGMMTVADPKFRLGYLRSDDPAVRLATVLEANLESPDYRSALQWHAVNDASDAVRAAAYTRLIATGEPSLVEEGYRGVRDDSLVTRSMVLLAFVGEPSAAHKPATLLAIADQSPAMRVLALDVLSTLPGDITLKDVSNVLEDRHPEVQLALLRLAKARNLNLPAATLDLMKESPDRRVVTAAGG